MGKGETAGWVTGILITVAVVGIPIGLATVPMILGPAQYAEGGLFGRPVRWEVDEQGAFRWNDRDVLAIDAYGVARNGSSLETSVYRMWLVDRRTGEILGEHTSWYGQDLGYAQGGRLWTRSGSDDYVAFTLPDLREEATLSALLEDRDDLPWSAVEEVYFPAETDAVRLLAKDGFLWDLHPDLTTLTKLHHDTPVPQSVELHPLQAYDPGTEVELPSGRIAMLGTQSRRPALRVADVRGALETTEVKTPLEGFLDGRFLGMGWGVAMIRPPEDVFIRHTREDGGGFQLSRVSAREGLRWTKTEDDWSPGFHEEGGTTELIAVEEQVETLFLWLATAPPDHWSGNDHLLVGVDPETGDAKWVTRF